MTIEHDDNEYLIADGDNAGDRVPFGDAAFLETEAGTFAAFLESPTEAWEDCEAKIYKLEPVETSIDEVDFEESDEEESEEGSEDSGED